MIDYAAIARAGGIGKGEPKKTAKAKRTKARVSIDERESDKVRVRSKGQCEVRVVGVARTDPERNGARCRRRAWQIHHHLGGFGVRGRGESALAKNKSHVCADCHERITGKTLQHAGGQRYRKVT